MDFWKKKKASQKEHQDSYNMEELLCKYVDSLQTLRDSAKRNPQIKFDTYHALMSLGTSFEPENGEAKKQEVLLNKLHKNKQYEYVMGRNSHGKATFCQITTNGYELDDEKKPVQKLYINCERDKVADIVLGILKGCSKQKVDLSMKFVYEDGQSNNYLRNDKIVIYCEDDGQKSKISGIVNETAKAQPELFDEGKTIPFMPKLPESRFISSPGITQRGRYTVYNSSGGNLRRSVVNTYNNVLAEALQEAFVISTTLNVDKSYSEKDDVTGSLTTTSERMKESLDCYERMDEHSRASVIKVMKDLLPELCKANNIAIDSNLTARESKMELPVASVEEQNAFYSSSNEATSIDYNERIK